MGIVGKSVNPGEDGIGGDSPRGPRGSRGPHGEEEEPDQSEQDEVLQDGEALEVIDLDQLLGDPPEQDEQDEDEDDDDDEMHMDVADNSRLSVKCHKGKSVFSVDVTGCIACSGGEDDVALIWDYQTGNTILQTQGFKDSVTETKFSHDGMYMAAADMSGLIKVWKKMNSSATWESVWEFETCDTTWLSWHPATHVLFTATVDSQIWMFKIPSGESKIFAGNGEKVETARVLPDGKKLAAGYTDGSFRIFDLKSGSVLHNVNGNNEKHASSITSIDVHRDNHLLVTGSLDGTAKLFHLGTGKNIGTFGVPNQTSDNDSVPESAVESVLFSPENQTFVTGSLNGDVTVWDISSQVAKHSTSLGSGIVKMIWRINVNHQLIAATLDGVVTIYDVKKGEVVGKCTGHLATVLDICQNRDGNQIISSSDDGTCRIFDIDKIIQNCD